MEGESGDASSGAIRGTPQQISNEEGSVIDMIPITKRILEP